MKVLCCFRNNRRKHIFCQEKIRKRWLLMALEAVPCWLLLSMGRVLPQDRQPQLPLHKGLSHPETQQPLGVIAPKAKI